MEDEVFLYCEEHRDAGMDALIRQFGAPEDVANDFLPEVNAGAVNQFVHVKQRILVFLAVTATAAIILVSATEILTCYKRQRILDGYYIESITYEGDATPYITGPTYAVEYFSDDEGGHGRPLGNPQK